MKFVIKKVPKLALAFYIIGFIAIGLAMASYFKYLNFLNQLQLQQLFLGGAIIVAIGSVVNTLHQLNTKK